MLKLNRALAALGVVFFSGCGNQPQGSVDGTTGSLFVDSAPQGASVFVDDVAEGFTPTTVTNLDVGDHALRLELAGYASFEANVTVEAGANNTPVMAELEPTVAQVGFLAVTTDPATLDGAPVVARVVLNGSPIATMTNGESPAMIEVDPTEPHDVGVALDGFLAVTQENVSCASGATVPVAVPIGADVNGQFRGSVDGRIVTVESGVGGGVVYLRIVGEDGYTVKGNHLYLPETNTRAGEVNEDHNSFHISVTGYDETFARL